MKTNELWLHKMAIIKAILSKRTRWKGIHTWYSYKIQTVKTIFLKDAYLSELKDKEMITVKVRIVVSGGKEERGL